MDHALIAKGASFYDVRRILLSIFHFLILLREILLLSGNKTEFGNRMASNVGIAIDIFFGERIIDVLHD